MTLGHGIFCSQDETTVFTIGMALAPFVVFLVVMWRACRANAEWSVLSAEMVASIEGSRSKGSDLDATRPASHASPGQPPSRA